MVAGSELTHSYEISPLNEDQKYLKNLLQRAVPILWESDKYSVGYNERDLRDAVKALCFGPDGYLNKTGKSPEDIETQEYILTSAMDLAKGAHGAQSRETGEPFFFHPWTVMLWYLRAYRMETRNGTGAVLHDVPEDTSVTLDDIQDIYGEPVRDFVDVLTKVRLSSGKTDIVATQKKFILAAVNNPAAAAFKVFDALHNMKTIFGHKDEKKRVKKAYEALDWVVLAKIMGLPEADLLADLCYVTLMYDSGRSDIVEKMLQLREEILDTIDPQEVEKHINKLRILSGIVDVRVNKPGLFEIADRVHRKDSPQPEDFYLNITFSIPDEVYSTDDKIVSLYPAEEAKLGRRSAFAYRGNAAVNAILASPLFTAQERNAVGFTGALDQTERTILPYFSAGLYYHQTRGESPLPVRITIYRRGDFDLRETPLTYVPGGAVVLSYDDSQGYSMADRDFFHERQTLAEEKLKRISEQLTTLYAEAEDDDTFVRHFLVTLPDSKVVKGLKARTGEFVYRPVPASATILDYMLLIAPQSWQSVQGVLINGESVNNLGYVLKEGDTIELLFGERDDNNVSPAWLNTVTVKPEVYKLVVIDKIRQREQYLAQQVIDVSGIEATEKALETWRRYLGQIRDYGWMIIAQYVPQLEVFGLSHASKAFPDPMMDPRDFAEKAAMGEIHERVIDRVAEALNSFWQSSSIVVVEVPNKEEMLAKVSQVFSNYGLNIDAIISKSKWGDTARLEYRIDTRNPNYPRLDKVSREIEQMLVPINVPVEVNLQELDKRLSEIKASPPEEFAEAGPGFRGQVSAIDQVLRSYGRFTDGPQVLRFNSEGEYLQWFHLHERENWAGILLNGELI